MLPGPHAPGAVALRHAARRRPPHDDASTTWRRGDDPTLVNEQLVVTVDAQLFYSVLSALPYLVNYPYECTEQTLNRFVSTGILSALYDELPGGGADGRGALEARDAARDLGRRRPEPQDGARGDARGSSRRRGGDEDAGAGLTNVLDPRIAKAEREAALAKLRKAQTSSGGFPWWPGGPPSPYMTLYILYGFAKAAEFGVDVPRDMVERGLGVPRAATSATSTSAA